MHALKVQCESTLGDTADPSDLQYAVHKRIEEAYRYRSLYQKPKL